MIHGGGSCDRQPRHTLSIKLPSATESGVVVGAIYLASQQPTWMVILCAGPDETTNDQIRLDVSITVSELFVKVIAG